MSVRNIILSFILFVLIFFVLFPTTLILIVQLNITSYDGIRVSGSDEFDSKIVSALELLKEKDPEAYEIVLEYVDVIKESPRSGMKAYGLFATCELSNVSLSYSNTWSASVIAHESYHSKLFHDYQKEISTIVPDHNWIGQEAELKCLAHQAKTLKNIDAPLVEINHCENSDGTHADIDGDGDYDWDDYYLRDW